MEKTVVALFDSLDAAQTAVKQLIDSGFSRDDISVVRTNQQGDYTTGNVSEDAEHNASGAAAGAGIGAVLGGLAGLLVGLGALAIPGIGPIIAAGPLATTLAGAGLGAATGGLVGALADAGIPEKEAGAYAEGVRRGGTLVTVRADEDMVTHATEILNRFNPVDINQRTGEWDASSYGGPDTGTGVAGTEQEPTGDVPAATDWSQSPDFRAPTGFTGENSGGTYEGTGSAGYTGSGTIYRGEGSFTSNTEPSRSEQGDRSGYTDTGAVYGGGDSYASDMDKPNRSDVSESPDQVGSSNWADEDSVMRSGHGAMSTSTGFSGQGGGTYERMQQEDPTVHPRSAEGDYHARKDFVGESTDETEGNIRSHDQERQDEQGMIETGAGTYGSQGQDYQPSHGTFGQQSSQGEAWQGQYGGHQGALAGGEDFTGGSSGDDLGTTGVTFRSGPGRRDQGQSGQSRRVEDYEPDFRNHWESNYRGGGAAPGRDFHYERYQPAYVYGWQAGQRYQGQNWQDFEAQVRTDWEQNHPDDAWQDFRPAIYYGWQQFSGDMPDQGAAQQGAQDEGREGYMGGQPFTAGQSYDRTVGDMSRGFDTYDQDFRSDWQRSYGASGYDYQRYQPAYQYGYNLATDAKYRSHNWSDIEPDARRDWEMRHPNDAWEDFKAAIQHAWDRVRGGVNDALD